jgi:hypothetical protein
MPTKKKAAKKASPKSAKKAAPKKKAPAKKKAARRLSLTDAGSPLTVSVEFRLGAGKVTVTQFRKGVQIDEQVLDITSSKVFNDVRKKDVLSIDGACAGKGKLTTDRNTTPASAPPSFRQYPEGNISDGLIIN